MELADEQKRAELHRKFFGVIFPKGKYIFKILFPKGTSRFHVGSSVCHLPLQILQRSVVSPRG
jgi:hypothetical protein